VALVENVARSATQKSRANRIGRVYSARNSRLGGGEGRGGEEGEGETGD